MHAREKVAIVGSGVSGLGALWALKSTDHEVHLFESNDRIGGHTNTCTFEHNGQKTPVDTGFIVFNSATYPNFINFLKAIKVKAVPTDMTFGVSRDRGLFEWAGTSLGAVFAQKSNIFKRRVWLMLFDIIRFNQFALDLLSLEDESEEDDSGANGMDAKFRKPHHQQTIGEYLDREGYSEAFRNDYLIPMTAAVWSTSPDKCSLNFPAITLVRFMWNHHLLTTISARPTWMTLKGGSQQYVDAILKDFPKEKIHLKTGVASLNSRDDGRVELELSDGSKQVFDHVVLATHGDQATEIIRSSATPEELKIMSNFATSENIAVLHSDLDLMPKREIAWSAWNYLTTRDEKSTKTVSLTYWMNLLQHIPSSTFGEVLVTLNPIYPPHPDLVQGTWTYRHPLYTPEAIQSQRLLPRIQNTRSISYAGAWTKYGFHEDGFSSGVKVAVEHLGAKLPFEFVDSTFSRGRRPVLTWKDYLVRVFVYLIQIVVILLGWGIDLFSSRGKNQQGKVRL